MDLLYGYSGTFSYLCRITRLNGMQGYCRKTCAALLLILFAGYWGSVTLFPHAHHVDGFVIVHSHPFSGAANGSAPLNHTPQQFQLIAHLSLLVMVAAVALSFAARLLGVRYVFRMMRPVGCLRPAHPHLLAAGASRVLNRPCVRKDCTSLRRPGPRKGDVSVIQ